LSGKFKPLLDELAGVKKRVAEIDAELTRYVKPSGKGTVSVKRLERQMMALDKEEKLLLARQEELQAKSTKRQPRI